MNKNVGLFLIVILFLFLYNTNENFSEISNCVKYDIVILRTPKGYNFANEIKKDIHLINKNIKVYLYAYTSSRGWCF